ncbi:MAG: DUF3211 domain-containing protein [Candidatus Aramenus sp.]|nr:DUF3211 domain-containing protein [Candidatus Aramenus sp.]
MIIEVVFRLTHETDAFLKVVSDPSFLIPKVFPPVYSVEVNETRFVAYGKYMGVPFTISGNVFTGENSVTYAFTLSAKGGKGSGRLTVSALGESGSIKFDFEGFMHRLAGTFLIRKWLENFAKNLNEEVRLERIKRKI